MGTVRSAASISAIALASIAGACNAISGADGLVTGEAQAPVGEGPGGGGDDVGTTTSSSASSSASGGTSSGSSGSTSGGTSSGTSGSSGTSSGTSGTSGNPPVDSGSPSTTFLMNQTFDTAAECTKGAITNGGTAVFDAAGHCVICATAAGDTMYSQTTTLTMNKTITLDTNVRRQSGPSTVNITMLLGVGGAMIQSGASVTGTSFMRFTAGSVGSAPGVSVTAGIGIKGGSPGDCIVVDDLRVPYK